MTAAEDHDRFDEFVRDVVEPVRRYLLRRTDPSTADDVLGETLLVCWRRVAEIPHESAVAWSIGVARLCLTNSNRSETRRRLLATKVAIMDPPVQTWEQFAEGDEAHAGVRAALAQLSEADAEILRLWAWDDLSPSQIAIALGVTANTAGVRLHRARGRLRSVLDSERSTAWRASPAGREREETS